MFVLTLDKVYQASQVLREVIRETDMILAPNIHPGTNVYLKTENLQVTGSFKIRGSYYKISKLYEFDGLNKVEVKEATIGSIVAISGIADIHIGDTLCGGENPEAIPFQKISEPTIAMNFIVNDSPLAG